MQHHCHVEGCNNTCIPKYLMCRRHWYKVPKRIQNLVYKYYRVGQCNDMDVSVEWFIAARLAINHVAYAEKVIDLKMYRKRIRHLCKRCLEEGIDNIISEEDIL